MNAPTKTNDRPGSSNPVRSDLSDSLRAPRVPKHPKGLPNQAFSYGSEPEFHDIPCGAEGRTTIRIVRPKTEDPTLRLPVVVYFNWFWRNRNTTSDQDRFIGEFAASAQVAVVCVDQNHPEDCPKETAAEEAYAATHWVATNGVPLQLDTSRLGVAAENTGGPVLAAVRRLAEQRHGPRISFEVLF
jgi:acetyl esterase